jgi:biopolymer transport protein TolQ
MPTSTSLPDLSGVVATAEVVTHDMSLWNLFMSADIVVQLIMIGLLIASFWSWTIIFNKGIRLRNLFASANQFEDSFWSGGPLDLLYERIGNRPRDPMSAVFAAAMREWKRMSESGRSSAALPERIERAMHVTLSREMDRLERHMGFLATLGSTAPFVGLFGTVWGIMNSFQSIASSQNTSLAVVAPGIAEALFATAIGLVAAIPAAIAYNKFSLELNRYANRLDSFTNEFGAIISRQFEEGN